MLNIAIPNNMQELSPKITVIGVGGAGGNAVNNMIESNLEGVDFVVANTDGQALANSIANRKITVDINIIIELNKTKNGTTMLFIVAETFEIITLINSLLFIITWYK